MTVPAGPLAEVAAKGFARVPGAVMATLMGEAGKAGALAPFFASWDRLETDAFMRDGGRYRPPPHREFLGRARRTRPCPR
jgi:hypothetical protein